MKKRRCHGKTLLVPARQVFRQTVKDIFQIELLAELLILSESLPFGTP